MSSEVAVTSEDKIVILSTCGDVVALSKPIQKSGNKFKVIDVLEAFQRGLNKPFISGICDFENDVDKDEFIYDEISRYFSTTKRLKLKEMYSNNELRPKNLCGDFKYFEGIERRGKYLHMYIGS